LSIHPEPVDVEVQEKFLNELRDCLHARYPELLFSMASGKMDGVSTVDIPVMLIAQKTLHHHPPYGLVSRVQVTVQYKVYTISMLMRVWRKEAFESFDDLDAVCKMVGNNTKHKFCPGIKMNRYLSEYKESIGFHIKSTRLLKFLFLRVDSKRCICILS